MIMDTVKLTKRESEIAELFAWGATKKKVSFIRIAAIYALAFVAIFGILGCPDESLSFGQWFGAFIVSKAIGFAAILGIVMLIGGIECVKAFKILNN